MANTLSYDQAATFLMDIYEQATGLKAPAVIDTASFTSVATTLLRNGYDNVINAITQVVARTIFSVRPYTAKFTGIQVDEQRFGAITRKINFVDGAIENDDRLPLTDGTSIDPWVISKPVALQTNWYGGSVYQRHVTWFRDQLDVAFRNAGELAQFEAGVLQNVMDQLEQVREAESRATLANFIGAKAAGDTGNVINVLQEYKDETGTSLTVADMYSDDNYIAFAKWLYSFINGLTRKLAERTSLYHMNVAGKTIMRHTPPDRLKAYMSASVMDKIDSIALPSIFGADRLKMIDFEAVTYWQAIEAPQQVIVTPGYINAAGEPTTGAQVTVNNIVGLLFDEEALGLTRINEWAANSPFNPRGGYTNSYYHFTHRAWNDLTESGILLIAADPT